jgi:hypothetical protein
MDKSRHQKLSVDNIKINKMSKISIFDEPNPLEVNVQG